MNLPLTHMYRLSPRGGGLACDAAGVALGPTDLVRIGADATGRRRYEVRPPQGLGRILSAAYGPQPENVVSRLHHGLRRAASAIEAGDLCLAGVETVLLRLPELTPSALGKLAEIAELEKWGTAWQDQQRVPAGQSDGGQWTSDGGVSAPVVAAKPAPHIALPTSKPRQNPALPIDDGVYRPEIDRPHAVLTAGGEEEEEESRGTKDFKTLDDVFPGLKHVALHAVLAPIDGFLGASAVADEADLEATKGQYWALLSEIKQVDPSFADQELLPEGGLDGLSSQGRANLISNLRMQRAALYYRMRGDVGPLQVETFRFLQNAVDDAYDEGVELYDAGKLQPRLSKDEAIGNWIDPTVRAKLQHLFFSYGIPYGPGADVTVNNRDYESPRIYRIPDARISDVSFDWTLTLKTNSTPQVRGYFRTASRVRAVIIVRPSQLGRDSTYLIPRPANVP